MATTIREELDQFDRLLDEFNSGAANLERFFRSSLVLVEQHRAQHQDDNSELLRRWKSHETLAR